MYKRREKAYMTAEAAMIYPFIFGGILFTIYMGFYLYNSAVMKQTAYIAALRGSVQKEMSDAEMKLYTDNQLETLLKDKLLFAKKIQKETEVSKTKVRVRLKANMTFTGMSILGTKRVDLECFAETTKASPVRIIRNVRKLHEG